MAREQEKTTQKSIWVHYKAALGKSIWMFLIAGIFYSLGAFFGGILSPLYYKGIIDSLASPENYSRIYYFFYLLLGVNVLQYFFSRTYEYIESTATSKGEARIASYALNHLSRHSYQFFTDNFAGSLVTKARRFSSAFETMSALFFEDFLYAVINILGILFVLFRTSATLGFVAFGWFVLLAYAILVRTKKRIPLERERGEKEARTTGVLSDVITNILNLKLFSSKTREGKYFDEVLEEERVARSRSWTVANNSFSINGAITLLAQSSLVFVSIFLWSKGMTTAGTIVLVMSYSNTLFNRLSGLGRSFRQFSDAYTNATDFAHIIEKDIEITDPRHPETLKIKAGEIVFDHVGFSYKNSKEVLTDFNLYVAPGEKIGVVGTSGAGKTTITKLLLRFADVTGGAITIDGQDIRKITQDDLRSTISYVPQDPILFHRTLRENIAYGKPDATEEEIIEAAKQAHAHEFIENLSHGYETLVGERGVKLSGGERQRVAIARAILKNAPILILDEATSALDSVSETHIKEALTALMHGKTTIVIAHRLSTIEKMDRIIVMEKGQIVEEGDHKTLLALKGIYFNFWNHQYKGFIK